MAHQQPSQPVQQYRPSQRRIGFRWRRPRLIVSLCSYLSGVSNGAYLGERSANLLTNLADIAVGVELLSYRTAGGDD